jgi:hypothetical protein
MARNIVSTQKSFIWKIILKNKLIIFAFLGFSLLSANAQIPSFPKELKGLADALTQKSTPTLQPSGAAIIVKPGTYVGTANGKQFRDNFITISASDSNKIVFYVEAQSDRGSFGQRDGSATRKGNIFLHAEDENSANGQCEISFESKGEKLFVNQKFVCGMGAGAGTMAEYVFIPNFKPVTFAEKERAGQTIQQAEAAKNAVTKPVSSGKKVSVIPKGLHGIWADDSAQCKVVLKKDFSGDVGITISKSMIAFSYISRCEGAKNQRFDGTKYQADFNCYNDEGEVNLIPISVSLLNANTMTIAGDPPAKYVRCK